MAVLLLHRHRGVEVLLQNLHVAHALVEHRLGGAVEVRTELGERLELLVLRLVELQRSGDFFMDLICADPPTRLTEMPTLIAGRTPERKRLLSKKI